MTESIIIIGAGIAGLAAGCYAQMNGYRSQIFEMHDLPGGLCTAWQRKGYTIDGCIHYLFGSGAGQPFNNVWQELGALEGRSFIHHEEFMRIVDGDGRTFIVYADPDRLEQHMKALSPQDADLAADFAEGVRQFMAFDLSVLQAKPRELMTAADWLDFNQKVLPYALPMARWGMQSAREFGEKFSDPLLRRAFPLMFGWGDIPVMVGMSVLAYMATGNAGFPAGGSLDFARAIERKYLSLGGAIHYKSQVEKILVQDNRAVGVRLYNDDEHHADVIISACDGHATIFDMLDGAYTNRGIERNYNGSLPLHTQLQVSLGVDRDLSAEPHWVTYLLDEPQLIAGEEKPALGIKHYCFDPGLAPPGKSVVELMIESDYNYWRRLYDMEQLQVAAIVLDFLEEKYPGIKGQVEVKDVATPLSYERYTGNWQGATCGWLLTKKTMMMMVKGMSKTLPRLDNFYMIGQWVEPGGSVPLAAMSGRNAIQLLCDEDDKPFMTAG